MEVNKLVANNLRGITYAIDNNGTIGVAGLSGSGKSSFCTTIADESIKRVVTLLPKSEYRFLFGDKIKSNYSAAFISELPQVFYLGKTGFAYNPRSTVGTHTGIFREIRGKFASELNKTTEFFSFNNSIMWCDSCKGRGSTAGKVCKVCNGSRYNEKIKDYNIEMSGQSYDITRIFTMNAYKLLELAGELSLSDACKTVLKNLIDLNVGYLSLDRVMSTLSGGETVRVLLAEFMAHCKNSLIIVDEISIGLDHDTLIRVLEKISHLGNSNQIWLIDHSDTVLEATDKIIYFGPGSGKEGGNIVRASPRPEAVYRTIDTSNLDSVYTFKKLRKRNIDIDVLCIPKNRLTTITGESGCGKSTLVNDCIIPYFNTNYKNAICVTIGQDRNQSITSKSTIASFLDITKRLNKYDKEILELDLNEVLEIITKDKYIRPKIELLLQLGLGYLFLNRKVQTLSTGEFQCLHLVSKLTENMDKEMLLIFDEPSKGLSQNILNLLMGMMSKILEDSTKTILVIEHNPYFLSCSDYVVDFGKRTENTVMRLEVVPHKNWIHKLDSKKSATRLLSGINSKTINGISYVTTEVDRQFIRYENQFKGGLLKQFSSTAQWIFGNYNTDQIIPIIVLDLESTLYSKNTFLYEIASIINAVISKASPANTELFDLYSKDNQCSCCKGTGKINTFDMGLIVEDINKSFFDGLLKNEVMLALKRYNYSKIQFLFKEIKKETGYDMNAIYSTMSEEVRKIFLYGYWDKSFYDKKKKTQRQWKGIIPLIVKYMKASNGILKKKLGESNTEIVCPVCDGSILNHKHELLIDDIDIREVITKKIKDLKSILSGIERIQRIVDILGDEIKLNMDISTLPLEKQVCLKLFEIEYANLQGYKIVLKNTAPFASLIDESIKRIALHNKVILLNYTEINMTKQSFIEQYFAKGKLKAGSYVYEVLGFSKINTEINKIRKSHPCPYCNGHKVLREESIFEGVDVTETPCNACGKTGINNEGLEVCVNDIPVELWIKGKIGDLNTNIPSDLNDVPLMSKIGELNKKQLYFLKNYKEGHKC